MTETNAAEAFQPSALTSGFLCETVILSSVYRLVYFFPKFTLVQGPPLLITGCCLGRSLQIHFIVDKQYTNYHCELQRSALPLVCLCHFVYVHVMICLNDVTLFMVNPLFPCVLAGKQERCSVSLRRSFSLSWWYNQLAKERAETGNWIEQARLQPQDEAGSTRIVMLII